MSLVPPYDRPVFPSNDDIVGAELDWMYEAGKCLYCREHGGITLQKQQYKQKTERQSRVAGTCIMMSGQKSRVVMKKKNPFQRINDQDSDDDDEDDDEDDEEDSEFDDDGLNIDFI